MKSYHALWTETWKLFRKYGEQIPLNDVQWAQLVDDMEDLVERYPEHEKLAIRLVVEISNELERMDKERRQAA